MALAINVDTGAVISDPYRIGLMDASVRILTPLGQRALRPTFGTTVYRYTENPTEERLSTLEGSITKSLEASSLYTVVSVSVTRTGDTLLIDVSLQFPEGISGPPLSQEVGLLHDLDVILMLRANEFWRVE